ncbi:autophagy-related protein 2 [Magnolia sinica]|uniref:autophagy-related protein 2 n=1 Tax=Magnolia sinica TaxID=86752 RepID=UPI00265AFA77|nr:autophagy-related protein 2 [Magnolia sinica]
MFRWNIARSAEAMFSRWAIKRVCKFLLKKKLGKFILGDIDLEQLDVQLGNGTIQLTDLALNVDYLNQKLGETPVTVKEGSIGSILAIIPWKVSNCQIEVDELELVLAPCAGSDLQADTDKLISGQDGKQSVRGSLEKVESEAFHGSDGSISLDVHEGVKTIAKMVKWLLTSFNVKIKNLIVAFDPCLEKDDKQLDSHRILVLRISETEYGTCVSEDSSTISDSRDDNFLGMTRLTNFVKFQGAILELLQTNCDGNQSPISSASGTTFSDRYTGSSPSGTTTPVLNGEIGGFSGMLKLSIPWKKGSLDIRKVDADLTINPVVLRLQPSTINWIIFSWEYLKHVGIDGRSDMHHQATESVCLNSASCYHSFTLDSDVTVTSSSEKLTAGICSLSQETTVDASLPGPHVISNWVPLLISKNHGAEAETEYSASIDQFFECFDGMRSSQAALANTGIWNWSCSVFSAITAASSLASGSVHIPSEQQHVETNLRATVVGISVVLSLHDEDQDHPRVSRSCYGNTGDLNEIRSSGCSTNCVSATPTISSMNLEQSNFSAVNHIGQNVHYLEAKCQDLVFTLQICSKKLTFEAMIKHINVDDYFGSGSKVVDSSISNHEQGIYGQKLSVQQLQAIVQGVLPPFTDSEETENGSGTVDDSLCISSMNGNLQGANHRTVCKGELIQVNLLKSLSAHGCQFAVSQTYSDDRSSTSTSLSVKLPPFILWVDFNLVNMLLGFCNNLGDSSEISHSKNFRSNVSGEKLDSSCRADAVRGTCKFGTTASLKGSFQGNIFIPHGKIILCFPSENHGDFRHCYWDKFIGLDFSPSLTMEKDTQTSPIPNASPQKGYSCPPNSIGLNFGDLNIYLITSACKISVGNDLFTTDQPTFSAEKILSATRGTDGHHSAISMIWQGGPVTGPWIARRAWCLATSQDSGRTRNKMTGKGYEFASATTAKDTEQTNSCVRQEMILSSAFVLHICLSFVWINLGSSEYILLHRLLNQVVDDFTRAAHATEATLDDRLKKEHAFPSDGKSSQVSVLVECAVVDLSINMEKGVQCRSSIQKELSGSWDSLRLTVDNFELLSVSNTGGISSASFFWVSHDEGELWGCLNGIDDEASVKMQDLLLISCKNSIMRRGNGGGTNVLSSGSAGTAIVHLWDPKAFRSFTSITVRCGTIIAPGGRLDWFSEICSFFSLPSCDSEQADSSQRMHKDFSENNTAGGASFFLELVDVALSYEPHCKNSVVNDGVVESERSSHAKPIGESGKQHVACLLAAASLNLSNETVANFAANDYRIRLQDLGLLLCSLAGSADDIGTYDAEYLCKSGFVKVAEEALVEAVLRTNCNNGLLWELECLESHVNLDTCHDTTAGLIHLVDQIQQLFAPDIEESVVHLETRRNTVQQAYDGHDTTNVTSSSSASADVYGQSSSRDAESRSVVVGLMDGILEDAFYLNGSPAVLSDSCELQSHISLDGGLPGDASDLKITTPTADDVFPLNVSFNRLMPGFGLDNIQASASLQKACSPEFIEGYYISEFLPMPKIPANSDSLNEVDLEFKSKHVACVDVESGTCGWYEDSSLRIIENHVSRVSGQPAGKQIHEKGELPSDNSIRPSESCKPRGRILLQNIDVRWKMYAGSDWPNDRKNVPLAQNTGGRDATVCLELMLSGMSIQYDMFPDGNVYVSKLVLSVQDFHLYDRSRDAPWKMVLGYYQSKDHPRESCAKAFKLDLEAVRPDPLTPLEEYRLRLAFLPMRFNLEQGQLDFLISFFARNDSSFDQSSNLSTDLGGTRTLPSNGVQTIVEEAVLPFFQASLYIYPLFVVCLSVLV